MSEYMEKHTVSRLLGAPPGFVGYEEPGQLSEAIRRRPYRVILFDEIEKAHPEVLNILLQLLDDGRLTDSHGRTVDFKNTVVIMTSNVGGTEMSRHPFGFRKGERAETGYQEQLTNSITYALKKTFNPEFLNRIDEVIRFRPLSPDDLQRIVRLQLAELSLLLAEQGLALRVDDEAVEALALQGYEPEYGARPLRRVLRRRIENPLATELLAERFKDVKIRRIL